MAEPSMTNVPPGFQVFIKRMSSRLEVLTAELERVKGHYDDMARRLAAVESEQERRKGGRPKKVAAE